MIEIICSILIITTFVGLVADIITTELALSSGAIEGNPVMRWLMDRIGVVAALIVTKVAFLLVLLAVLGVYGFDWWTMAALAALTVMHGGVALWNFSLAMLE